MSEEQTMNVVVHKANVPMLRGESLDKFIGKLSQAARAHGRKKFAMSGVDWMWMPEAFASSVIVSVDKKDMPRKMFAMSYKRDLKTGDFTFGEAIEVERKVSFSAVKPGQNGQLPIRKATDVDEDKAHGEKPKKTVKAVEQLEVSKGMPREFGNEKSVWVETSKSFWAGANL